MFNQNTSVANIYGGTVFYPQSVGSSLGGVPGGGTTNIYGGNITYLASQDTGIMDVFGTGLTETFLESSSPFLNYSVTGTLQDGTPLNVLYASNNGTLRFNGLPAVPLSAVPEASTTVSFGLLLALGLGSVVVAHKKRQAAYIFQLTSFGPRSAPVPEASSTVSLGLLLALGLGRVVATRKKRLAA